MQRILAAVDDTEMARLVLARAVEVARATGGKVRLIHAVALPPPLPHPGVYLPIQADSLVSCGEALTRGLTENIPEELRDGSVIELGNAANAVCATARSYRADIVV